jgi:hypothetical protein
MVNQALADGEGAQSGSGQSPSSGKQTSVRKTINKKGM